MDLSAEAIAAIVGLALTGEHNVEPDARLARVFDKPVFYAPEPPAPPLGKTLEVSTLKSFAGYLKANVDGLALSDHIVHVESPWRVVLRSAAEDYHRRREELIAAVYEPPVGALAKQDNGQWYALEDAIILLMSSFTSCGQRDELLKMLRAVVTEDMEIREDTSLGQKVTVTKGVQFKETAILPNPVMLAPFRTFPEVSPQPLSPFTVRLRPGPQLLLRPADGGAWKLDAVMKIADALEHELGDAGDGFVAPAILY